VRIIFERFLDTRAGRSGELRERGRAQPARTTLVLPWSTWPAVATTIAS
jgi:hypothetical protein